MTAHYFNTQSKRIIKPGISLTILLTSVGFYFKF